MSRAKRIAAWSAALVIVVAAAGAAKVTKDEAHRLLTNPRATRSVSDETPADRGLQFEDLTVTSTDGTVLRGWFIPADSPRLILLQHGYKNRMQSMLNLAVLLHRRGYQVMVMCVRAHDRSDGEQLYMGQREMPDMEAWARVAESKPGVDRAKVGMFGVSMGGALAIQYTATHDDVKALVADSAFSSLEDTIDTSIRFFSGLPSFPFGSMIRFWAEREGDFDPRDVDAKKWIGAVSPRPVLIMQGGADRVVSVSSGQKLFDVAREPKEFWYEPTVGHGQFLKMMPAEFEKRVVGFFDRHLK
jgi:alpha-beta hydrolase superfamily lysophospholipase